MKLEVGDVLIRRHYSVESLVKVSRVTDKRAFHYTGNGEQALNREYEIREGFKPSIKQIGADRWNTVHYYKASSDDIARIQEKEKIRSLKAFIEVAIKSPHSLEALLVAANALGYKKEL